MNRAAVYVHGKGGSADEAAHYAPLFPGYDVIGFDYNAQTPAQARAEFPAYFDALRRQYDTVILIANSIGAYYSLGACTDAQIDRAFLISPIVDMETLILEMMTRCEVSEETLRMKKEIATPFGEVLSWALLFDVRTHPITWHVPTEILYGEHDLMTAYDTMATFARRIGAHLTVMKGGEHWFHTQAQMAFLDDWILRAL